MSIKPPCGKDCQERAEGCHGKCEKYQAYKAQLDASRPDKYAENDYNSYVKRVRLRNALHKNPSIRRNWKKEK